MARKMNPATANEARALIAKHPGMANNEIAEILNSTGYTANTGQIRKLRENDRYRNMRLQQDSLREALTANGQHAPSQPLFSQPAPEAEPVKQSPHEATAATTRPTHKRPRNRQSGQVHMILELPMDGAQIKMTVGERMLGTIQIDAAGIKYRAVNRNSTTPIGKMPWSVLEAMLNSGFMGPQE